MDYPKIKIISTLEEFTALSAQWDTLISVMEIPNPFISHSWILSWWKHFGEDNRLFIITMWDGASLIAAVPLMQTRITIQNVFNLRCLHSITNPHSPEFNIICPTNSLDTIVHSLKRLLIEMSDAWDILIMDKIPDWALFHTLIKDIFCPGSFSTNINPWEGSYYIPISGTFEQYFSGLNSSFKKSVTNKLNRLHKAAPASFKIIDRFDETELSQFYSIENSGWKKNNNSAIQLSPRLLSFYNEIAHNDGFSLASLYTRDTAIASVYGITYNGCFYYMKIGVNYDYPDTSRLSPGQTILSMLIQECYKRGLSGFDFCGAYAPYENRWTKCTRQKYTVTIYNLKSVRTKLYLATRKLLRPIYRAINRVPKNKNTQ